MLKRLLTALIITITIVSALTTLKISSKETLNKDWKEIKVIKKIIKKNNPQEDEIGNLIIEKINLNEPLFKIDSKKNNIEEHVTILKESILPPKENSIVFLAAHSGTGKIAYFEKLDNLEINDKIILNYKEKEYIYYVNNIWEEKKNGYINVNKSQENQLILTTCSPTKDNYQLVVNCISKS